MKSGLSKWMLLNSKTCNFILFVLSFRVLTFTKPKLKTDYFIASFVIKRKFSTKSS
jgi:hypothetical protein